MQPIKTIRTMPDSVHLNLEVPGQEKIRKHVQTPDQIGQFMYKLWGFMIIIYLKKA
jgi:hypothetical protein